MGWRRSKSITKIVCTSDGMCELGEGRIEDCINDFEARIGDGIRSGGVDQYEGLLKHHMHDSVHDVNRLRPIN